MQRLLLAKPQNDWRGSLTYSDFTETAVHREILYVYNNASPVLKAYYDLGRYTQGGNEENWVIRWAIYKCFRNSVNRGRLRTGSSSNKSTQQQPTYTRSAQGMLTPSTSQGSASISPTTSNGTQGKHSQFHPTCKDEYDAVHPMESIERPRNIC